MPTAVLNSSSPIPLYRQLADRLLADIDAGNYGIDGKIPSEHDLAHQFHIGRPTVRQATDLLVRQGRLQRRRGSGTYVMSAAPAIDVFSLAGTSAALRGAELNSTLEVIAGIEKCVYTPTDKECFRVQRIACVNRTPVLLETLFFDVQLFVGLDKHAIENRSLSDLVRDVYFLEPSSADQTFSVALADKSQSALLDVPKATPVLQVQRALHFGDQRNALHVEIVCRTDRYDFSQTLYPARAE